MPITFSGSGNPVDINGTNYGFTLTPMTQQNASGTSVDFTGIPSWTQRITVMFSEVSTSGTSPPQIQIGTSSGVDTTGYLCSNSVIVATVATANFTTGFGLGCSTGQWAAARIFHGNVDIVRIASNTWVASGIIAGSDGPVTYLTAGRKTLSSVLDRVRITTVNGTDTFDAGTINVMYE